MTGYRFLPPAEEEMIGAAYFYQAQSPDLGRDFLDEVQRGIDLLCKQPRMGSSVGRYLRHLPLRRFPFFLVYADEPDNIVAVAIAHQSRRPDYWRKRTTR